jgi:hypothetical protein
MEIVGKILRINGEKEFEAFEQIQRLSFMFEIE